MSQSGQKVVQYLNEAHASEVALIRVLQSQIAITPAGTHRSGLEKHLDETRNHAERLQKRLGELDERANPLLAGVGAAESMWAQMLALSKAPLDLFRGFSGEEKVLKNAKDSAAAEALEIATYTALEKLAAAVGDDQTAKLAASIKADEEKMLARILREIPKLAQAVVGAEVEGKPTYDVTTTGAAEATRAVAEATRESVKESAAKTRRAARKVPGVARAEGAAKGAVATEDDLPIARYDALTADEITAKLPDLSQLELAMVAAYESKKENRTTVLNRIGTLQGDEPWPGYDELTVAEIRTALADADEDRARATRDYERAHKNRAGVLATTERELSNA